jgi:acetate kinase
VRVLVVNAGSSSLKVDLVDGGRHVASYDGLPEEVPVVDAVGHRIVHGGPDLVAPVEIDGPVERTLRGLVELAPLHLPASLDAVDDARALLPHVPHVACFDTAFHATLPAAATTYALPRSWREQRGVRRYGFHGLSHAWASRRAAQLAPGHRVVSCHLGAGASLAAVLDGRSVDTTMGFTPLDGLVMATRSGSVDPGLLLWLQQRLGLSPAEVMTALEHESGLLGLAGTGDMRALVARDDPEARLALDVYLHRLAGGIAAMTVALGGLDTLVFTGGVGEGSPVVRQGAADRLRHLGVELDPTRNSALAAERDVSAPAAPVRTLVVAAREDLEISRAVEELLGPLPRPVTTPEHRST